MSESRKTDTAKKDIAQKGTDTRPPKEVFDSSKYDAMNDMTKGASVVELPDAQVTIDLQKQEPMNPEEMSNNSMTSENNPGAPSDAKINPMTVEERARTIREINEEATPDIQNKQEDVNAVERYDYSTMPVWTEAATYQYVQMANAGMELYAQFVRNATDMMDLWLSLWFPRNKQ